MRRLRETRAAASVIVLVAVAATLAQGVLGADGSRDDYGPAGKTARAAGGKGLRVVVGKDGKPVLGRDGKPLRVRPDGTLVDSTGRPVLGADGRPLKLAGDGTIPVEATSRGNGRAPGLENTAGRSPSKRRGTVLVGMAHGDTEAINKLYAQYGGKVRYEHPAVQARAVVAHINRHGGVGGRRMVVSTHQVDTVNQSWDAALREGCEFALALRPDVLIHHAPVDCHNFPSLAGGGVGAPSWWEPRYPHWYGLDGLPLDRWAQPYVDSLDSQGFFDDGAKVGVLRWQDADMDRAYEESLRPELARAGVRPAADLPFKGDLPDVITQLGSAVLRLRAAGVNRVITFEFGDAALIGLFIQVAEAQGYYPRYGISTMQNPTILRASLNPRNFRGAVGMGWAPPIDTLSGPDSPEAARCRAIYRSAGVSMGDRVGENQALGICSQLLMVRRLYRRGDLRTSEFRQRIESLGTLGPSALTFRRRIDAAHHQGAAAYRQLRFSEGCSCFEYHGGLRRLP